MKYLEYLESLKSKRYQNCEISFTKSDRQLNFKSISARDLFKQVIDWLYSDGYEFSGDFHSKKNQTRCLLTTSEVEDKISTTTYSYKDFHNIPSTDLWIMCATPVKQMYSELFKMLEFHDVSSIRTIGIDGLQQIDKVDNFDLEENDLIPIEEEPVTKIKVYKQNPFKQAICVLGESGAGKSVTIEAILENEDHNFEFIIPTAATTGLLAQFSPSKSGYVPSRLGKMLIEASKNPQTLYTAVFDEMHKSNVIEMINDELLQAISTKRNRGRRFISLDDDTAEIYQTSELDTERGNLLIPDNFGFIFISSKPRVIANNADFFNRVDIVLLKSYQEETIDTTEQLLSNKLSDEEKMKLASTRND